MQIRSPGCNFSCYGGGGMATMALIFMRRGGGFMSAQIQSQSGDKWQACCISVESSWSLWSACKHICLFVDIYTTAAMRALGGTRSLTRSQASWGEACSHGTNHTEDASVSKRFMKFLHFDKNLSHLRAIIRQSQGRSRANNCGTNYWPSPCSFCLIKENIHI